MGGGARTPDRAEDARREGGFSPASLETWGEVGGSYRGATVGGFVESVGAISRVEIGGIWLLAD